MNADPAQHEGRPVLWRPNPGPQTAFLASTAFEALYGGAAGGGKSDALLMGALKYVHVPSYRALLLRRTFPELLRSLIPKSFLRYPALGGKPNMSSQPSWRFPSGAVIEFGHLQHAHDVHKYQSAEYQYIGFDELTSFLQEQYVYMQSRLRGSDGVPTRVRSGTNPGGEGHEWVMRRWAPWLDRRPEYEGLRANPGQKLYYRNVDDAEEWIPTGVAGELSRVFYPAFVSDNPYIDEQYKTILGGLNRVERAQLRDGDWLIRPAAGDFFQRGWFTFVDAAPIEVEKRVRRWDLASTPGGGDWTVGVRLSRVGNGLFYVEHVHRVQAGPRDVRELVKKTAETDGPDCEIWIPQDPGQAGKDQALEYTTMLAGYTIHTPRETGDKTVRAGPASAQSQAGNVRIVRGSWNEAFLQVLESFPAEGFPDDDVDAFSGAVTAIALPPKSTFELWGEVDL